MASRRGVALDLAVVVVGISALAGFGEAGLATATGPLASSAVTLVPPAARYDVAAAHSPRLERLLAGGPPAIRVARTAGLIRGIDVSALQHVHGDTIDWASVAAAGYKFAFVKATEGSYYLNPYFAADAAAARRAGLLVAAYHFAVPNDSSPVLQADLLVNAAGDLTAGGRALPLIADLEWDPYVKLDHANSCYGLSAPAMVAWISAFVAEVQRRTGQLPVIYTIEPWWDACTGGSSAFAADPLWVAWSGTSPKLPAGWAHWQYWQYTSRAAVSGTAIKTDVSYFSATSPDAAGPATQSDAVGSVVSVPVRSLDAAAGQSLTWTASGLPAGLSIDAASGEISGTLPSTPGSYPVTVSVVNSAADSQALSFTWLVHSQVKLTWPGRQSSVAGGAVSLQIHARDGLAGCSLTFTASGLPPGLAISPCGRITGWPARPGSYRVTVRAAGSDGKPLASLLVTWIVRPPPVLATGRVRLALADMCLAVPAGRVARIWTCGKSAGQAWQISQNGAIQIGGKCLAELSPKATAPVLRPCTSLLGQVWRQVRAGGLANAQSGLCLADPGGSRRGGTAVTLSACDELQRQAWTLPAAPLAVGTGQCVAGVPGPGGSAGQPSLARCGTARAAGQDWTVAPGGTISVPGGCLTTAGPGAALGTPVTLAPCPPSSARRFPAQQWRPLPGPEPTLGRQPMPGPSGTGAFLVNIASGLCLAVSAQPAAGSPLALGYCLAGYPSLTWRIG